MGSQAKIADVGTATSIFGWMFMHSQGISLLLQWGVALVAIGAGLAAAYYHIKAARRL